MGKKCHLISWLTVLSLAGSPWISVAADGGNSSDLGPDRENSSSRLYDVDPIIDLTADTLYFESLSGSNPESSQSFTVSNTGGGTLMWEGTANGETWLTITPSSGSLLAGLSENVTVAIIATGIPGTYEADIAITDTSAENSPQKVHIIYNEIERPAILVDQDSLFFEGFLGESPIPDTRFFSITNNGGSIMEWQASKNAGWLSFLPNSGDLLPGQVDTVVVEVTATNSVGSYSDIISISDPNASNSPQQVHIYYDEYERPNIQLSQDSLNFESYAGDPVPNSEQVIITNTGGNPLNWSADHNAGTWLAISHNQSTIPPGQSDTLTVTITATDSPAVYQADITISDPVAGNSPQKIHVTFAEMPRPFISLSRDSLNFESYAGDDPVPNSEQVIITNTGGNPLNWSADHNAGTWLAISHNQSTISPGQSDTLTVTITATDSPAVYQADITISDPVAGNSPQKIHVTFAEMSRPFISISVDSLSFESYAGDDPVPNSEQVIITNTGGNPLNWSATHGNGNWLNYIADSGIIPEGQSDTLTVTISATGIAGEYQTELIIADPVAENRQVSVLISYHEKARPAIAISPPVLNFKSFVGEEPDPNNQIFIITNTGGNLLNWTASNDDAQWLIYSPGSGSLSPGESDTVMVQVSPTGSALFYEEEITIEDSIAANSPKLVRITYNEGTRPAIELDRDSLLFESVVGEIPSPQSQEIVITNIGGNTLNWSGSDSGATWLSFKPESGALGTGESDTLTVIADSLDIAGVYEAYISFTDPDAANSPKSIRVKHNVKSLPLMDLSPDTMEFESYSGIDPNPGSQYLIVTNPGGSTLNWVGAYPEVAWLSASPVSGSVKPGDQDTVSVTVHATGSAGLYEVMLEFTAAKIENSPQFIHVRYLEKQRPVLMVSADTLEFKSKVGENPVPDTKQFIITNGGSNTLNWAAEYTDSQWFEMSPTSGTLQPGGTDTLTVVVFPTGSADYRTAIITISDSIAIGSPKSIFVAYLEDNTVNVEDLNSIIPATFALHPNFPNPFNPQTTIPFDMPESALIRIEIFNLKGQKVKTLIDNHLPAGTHRVVWRGDSDSGQSMPSGIYFYRMVSEKFSRNHKMMLLR